MAKNIVLYGHRFCPQVRSVKSTLDRGAVPYDYVDIHKNEAGRLRVMEINAGNQSVPTLVFEDGSTLTEPSPKVLIHHLKTLGYSVDHQMPSDRIPLFLRDPYLVWRSHGLNGSCIRCASPDCGGLSPLTPLVRTTHFPKIGRGYPLLIILVSSRRIFPRYTN